MVELSPVIVAAGVILISLTTATLERETRLPKIAKLLNGPLTAPVTVTMPPALRLKSCVPEILLLKVREPEGASTNKVPVPPSVTALEKAMRPVVDSMVELAPVIVAGGVIIIFPEVVTFEKEALLPLEIAKLLKGPLIVPPTVTVPSAVRFNPCVPEIPLLKVRELEEASINKVPVPPSVTAFEKAIKPVVDSMVELAPVIVAEGVILISLTTATLERETLLPEIAKLLNGPLIAPVTVTMPPALRFKPCVPEIPPPKAIELERASSKRVSVPSSVTSPKKAIRPAVDSMVELSPVIVAAGVILISPEVVTLEKKALLPPKIAKELNEPLTAPVIVTSPPALRFKPCVPEMLPLTVRDPEGASIKRVPVPPSVTSCEKTICPLVDSIVELAPVIVAAGVILIFPEVTIPGKEALLPPEIAKLLNGPIIDPVIVTTPPALRFKLCVPEIPPLKVSELEGASTVRVPLPFNATELEKLISPEIDSIVVLVPKIVTKGEMLISPEVIILETVAVPLPEILKLLKGPLTSPIIETPDAAFKINP